MRVNEGARWFAPFALTSTDKGFRSVVDQIVLTSRKPEVMSQKKLSAKLARSRLVGIYPPDICRKSVFSGPIWRHCFRMTFSCLRLVQAPYAHEGSELGLLPRCNARRTRAQLKSHEEEPDDLPEHYNSHSMDIEAQVTDADN